MAHSRRTVVAGMCCSVASDTVQKLGVLVREQRLRVDLQRHALQCMTLVESVLPMKASPQKISLGCLTAVQFCLAAVDQSYSKCSFGIQHCVVRRICDASISAYESHLALSWNILNTTYHDVCQIEIHTREKTCVQQAK